MNETQIGIFWFCVIVGGLYCLIKSNSTKSTNLVESYPVECEAPPIPPPHPMEHLIQETTNFSYIKFDGATVYHLVSNPIDVPVALKELRFFKKVLNADKKQISDQLRTVRANVAGVKGLASLPGRSGFLKGARYLVRAGTSAATLPMENQKSLYNSLLLQCDRVQIDIERL